MRAERPGFADRRPQTAKGGWSIWLRMRQPPSSLRQARREGWDGPLQCRKFQPGDCPQAGRSTGTTAGVRVMVLLSPLLTVSISNDARCVSRSVCPTACRTCVRAYLRIRLLVDRCFVEGIRESNDDRVDSWPIGEEVVSHRVVGILVVCNRFRNGCLKVL